MSTPTKRALLEYENGYGIGFCVHEGNRRFSELVELIQANGGKCLPEPQPGTFCLFFQTTPTVIDKVSVLKAKGIVSTTIAWIYESILSGQLLPWYQYQVGVRDEDAQMDPPKRDLRELAMYMARNPHMVGQPEEAYSYLAKRLPHLTSDQLRVLHQQNQDAVHSIVRKIVDSIDQIVLSLDFSEGTGGIRPMATPGVTLLAPVTPVSSFPVEAFSKGTAPKETDHPQQPDNAQNRRDPFRIEWKPPTHADRGRPTTILGNSDVSLSSLAATVVSTPPVLIQSGSVPISQHFEFAENSAKYNTSAISSIRRHLSKEGSVNDTDEHSRTEEFESSSGEEEDGPSDDDETFEDSSDNEANESIVQDRKRKRSMPSVGRSKPWHKKRRMEENKLNRPPSRTQKVPTAGDLAVMAVWLEQYPLEAAFSRSQYWENFADKAPTSSQRPGRGWQYVYYHYYLPSQGHPTSASGHNQPSSSVTPQAGKAPLTQTDAQIPERSGTNESSHAPIGVSQRQSTSPDGRPSEAQHRAVEQPKTAPQVAKLQIGVSLRDDVSLFSGTPTPVVSVPPSPAVFIQDNQIAPNLVATSKPPLTPQGATNDLQQRRRSDPLSTVTGSLEFAGKDIMNKIENTNQLDRVQAVHVGKCLQIPSANINPGSFAVWERFVQVNAPLGHDANYWMIRYHEREAVILKMGLDLFFSNKTPS